MNLVFYRSLQKLNKLQVFLWAALLSSNVLLAQTVVQKYGRLRVNGNRVVSEDGNQISLAGNSLFWSNFSEGAPFYNDDTVNHLAGPAWNSDIVRAAMGVEDPGGFIEQPLREKAKVRAVVDAAIDAGIYVIIDFHSHNAEDYEQQAIDFFTEMSATYGNSPNVIYEIYNEPINQSWSEIKAYAEVVIDAIRINDPDNLIIVGTPFFSQRVDEASADPINASNIAYTLHFYAGTHRQGLRNRAITAMSEGIALFVTEWGVVEATGDGDADIAETALWTDFMQENNISHANWAIGDKEEGASVVASGGGVASLLNNDLTPNGQFIRDLVLNWNASFNDDGQEAFAVHNIPGILQAEDYDIGGQSIAYNDNSSGNEGNVYRNDDVDIIATNDLGNGFAVTSIENGEWLEYGIRTASSGVYDIVFRVSSNQQSAKSINASINTTDLGTIDVPNTGSNDNWQFVTIPGVTIPGGTDLILRLDFSGGGFNLNQVEIAPQEGSLKTYTFRARGTSGTERLRLVLGEFTIDTFTMSRNFQNYTVTSSLSGTPRIDYINDTNNRDAEVDFLQIDNVVIQAEDQIVNTSVFQNNSCGGTLSQIMNCPGFIEFDVNTGTLSLDSNQIENSSVQLTLFPNPTTDQVTISTNFENASNMTVSVINSLGMVVQTHKIQNNGVVSLRNLATGMYFINVIVDGISISKPVVKR